jgi:transposase
MSKTFRSWDVDQRLLLPPSVEELVPAGHLVHLVRESLELSAILGAYTEERGYPPYHPVMRTALLLYACCQGVYSSHRIARACEERLAFRAITAHQTPGSRTLAEFRRRHWSALFDQVLALCRQAGLGKLGHVALDGTEIQANASKYQAMSYGLIEQRAAEVAQ